MNLNLAYRIIGRCKPINKSKNADLYINTLRNKSGIEIGGPSNIFQRNSILPIYPYINSLDGCNFSNDTIWEGTIREGINYAYDQSKLKGYQYIRDAVDLGNISDNSYDFVLSSHNLEHIVNPVKALEEWIRVVKKDGYILLVVPDKNGTFDHKRNITSFDHLIADYNNAIEENDLSHLSEILEKHDLSMDKAAGNLESFKIRSLNNFNNRTLHHHVFDEKLLVQLFEYLNIQVIEISFIKPFHIIALGKIHKNILDN
jgi:SAM-dependent methyltransferase